MKVISTWCALTEVKLNDGNPLHVASIRKWKGRELVVCRAIANIIDSSKRPEDVERFIETMRAREARVA